jgi:hypothetical protein
MPAVRTDLGYFPRPQLGVKVLDDRIGTDRGDHSHIQDAPDPGATTPDTTAFAQATAVAVKGRQSGQCGDLFTIKCAQLGRVCEQSGRGSLPTLGTERSNSSRSRRI